MLSIEEALASSEPSSELRSVGSVLDILQKCRETKSLLHAKGMHLHICNQGLEAHEAVGVRLVPLFVECGSIPKAQQVFNRLNHQNEHCWTSLIQGFIDHGEPQRAFILFGKMQEDSVCPSRYTFVALLKAATKLKSMDKGHQIHAQVAVEGNEDDLFVGSSLVDMYAKFGLLVEAQEVFDELPARSVVSWTTLMAGYAEQGLGKEVMECFEKMQLEGVAPDAFTVVAILKACGSTGAVEKGREIHAQSAKEGFVRDPFVGNVLVDMYAKCGLLAEAQAVFDQLPARDVVSWNALIAGHAENGSTVKVLNSWEQMKLEGVIPNSVTFACILKACCNEVGAINKGQELHSEIVKVGFESDLFVGNSLIGLYAKCGLSAEAQDVFDGLPVQGVISWTALLDGYAEHGLGQEALDRLKQMQLEGMPPNAVTFVCSLKACGSIGAVDKVQEIHAEISKEGYESDLFVISMLMDTYTKCGSLVEAREVFDMLSVRDVVSWTALIAGYVEHGLGEEALKALEEMHKEHVSLNAVTFVCVLKACGSTGAVDRGQELHCEIVKKGLEDDLVVGNSLVDVYAKCGLPAEAQVVFDNLSVQDIVSWTALIAGYAQRGLVRKARDCFQEMQLEGVAPDVGSWNAMISAYADQGETEKACESYAQMQEQGLSPNEMTFVSILKACGNAAALETGNIIHAQIRSIGLETTGVELANALVDLYGKCGSMVYAQELFDAMSVRDVVTWNALITGYARQGECELVLQLFERMRKECIRPDRITLLIVLSTCNHAGFVEKGQKYFQAMRKEYNIAPTAMHHNIMVDLYGRAGQFSKAAEMLEEMPFQPNFVTWSTMLGACQTLGNIDLGRQAFDYAMRMDQKDTGAFILMSNLYAGVGRLGTDNGELMNME